MFEETRTVMKGEKMKYKITSTSFSYAEKLIEHYPVLNKFNLEAKEVEIVDRYLRIYDENDKMMYQPTYKRVLVAYVTIDTLEQLNDLIKAVDQPIIISKNDGVDEIEIYDNWRE